MFKLILVNLKSENERIVLCEGATLSHIQQMRKNWLRVLGGKHWTLNRRPGLDTLDHLGLKIVRQNGEVT